MIPQAGFGVFRKDHKVEGVGALVSLNIKP